MGCAAYVELDAGKKTFQMCIRDRVKAGKIEYRLDKTNIIHCPIGKVSFGPEKLGIPQVSYAADIQKAVSYTHLDVYKRQLPRPALSPWM